jgi:anti-sigma regulatory factor (Ser/Thr protein kinase)
MKLKFTFRSNLNELQKITQTILESCQQFTYSDEFKFDIRLVLEEIIVNLIKHGYGNNHTNLIDLKIDFNTAEWKMTVEDKGKPFNPLKFKRLSGNHSFSDMDIGGQGINIVKRISQKIEYKRLINKNRLTVTLRDTINYK